MKYTRQGIIALLVAPLGTLCGAEMPEAKTDKADGQVHVAAYYFPNWGPNGEWENIKKARPRFPGHYQPQVPLWGYENENDPKVMERKIDAAADHQVDAFIFDWYWYDKEFSGTFVGLGNKEGWDGSKFWHKALEEGYLHAKNQKRVKFALMWANHTLGPAKGAIKPACFDELCDYVITNYFTKASYWKIDGAPYFSIYEAHTFMESFGNDKVKAAEALKRFRDKVKAAGFPDLHLNAVAWGLREPGLAQALGFDSATSYVWAHHVGLGGDPSIDYSYVEAQYFRALEHGGIGCGLEKPVSSFNVPYHPNVSMGWDTTARINPDVTWTKDLMTKGYPYGAAITGNTPYRFREALIKAKAFALRNPAKDRIITINSWNEWTEGSYIEPDTLNGMGYLEAIREVFTNK